MRRLLAVLAAFVAAGYLAHGAVEPHRSVSAAGAESRFNAYIERVVDGDTYVARVGGNHYRVRLIGVDTPETVRPETAVRCWGPQASAFAHALLTHVTVRAAYEDGGRVDRYQRQLWDIWLPDGRFVAGVLAADGYARAYPVRPQVRYASVLRQLADRARAAHRGLWGPPCNGKSFS